ncbi:hypothetical protein [Novosphingobium malaysiense]|uniref:Spore coat protein U domain-containing protein n=1 Tax=Novosphingobium malaysiense TaxID=1348853 RepID=A0A0B1ZWJ2_9SPHN|nr:hypothetical protein [Novosphingobium malaysiense]KHK93548.1 hypothetical protein LK12_04695 [Novosphingobium malaysiense]
MRGLTRLLSASAMVAAFSLGASAAQAQATDPGLEQLYLVGDAPAACVISAPRASNAQNATFAADTIGSGQVTITQLVDNETAQARASSIELDFPVVCNGSHSVVVRSANGGLQRGGASTAGSGGGFSEFLAYTVGIDWAGNAIARQSDAGAATIQSSDPARGDLAIRISTPAGGGPLVAGQYNDSIVVELIPAN